MNVEKLKGEVVLVTGASSALGNGLAAPAKLHQRLTADGVVVTVR